MQSPSLLVTISYYSIPSGMLGRGLNKYQRLAADCLQRTLVPRITEAILPLRYADNARYWYTLREGRFYRYAMHSNSVHQSMSSWGTTRKLLDSMGPGLPIAASFSRVA